MGRSLGSAVDYGILSRNLQMAENVYMAPNRVFHAAFLGRSGAAAGGALLDKRVVTGLAPELMGAIGKNLKSVLAKAAAGSMDTALKQTRNLAEKEGKKVFKLAGDAWDDVADDGLKKLWDDAAVAAGRPGQGKQLFQEAAGNRAKKLVLQETSEGLAAKGFKEGAEALAEDAAGDVVLGIGVRAATKMAIVNGAAASKAQFVKLLESGTDIGTYKLIAGGAGLTLAGVGLWYGYKLTAAVADVVDRTGKTLFGDSWDGAAGITSYGADNPVGAGIMGWVVVLGGVALMYVLFKPKQAVVVS